MEIIPIAAVGSALPIPSKQVLAPSKTEPQTQRLKSILRFTGRVGVESLRWLSYTAILGSGLIFTSAGNKVTHEIGQNLLSLIPQPQARLIHHEIDGYKCDSFFSSQKDFSKIETIIKKLHINPKEIDTNNDGIILNSRADIERLHNILLSSSESVTNAPILENEINDALHALVTLSTHDQIIFGRNGIDPETFDQGGLPNCQILASLKGLSYTPENVQTLRSMIRVTGYDYTSPNKYLNVEVNIDGKIIPIEYPKLVKWMSPMYYSPSQANDGSLALPILASAIEEAGNSYDTVPHMAPSTSPILITGKDYYVLSAWSLDDDDIRTILSLAPEELVTVGSLPEDPSLKGIIVSMIDGAKEKLIPAKPPILSEQKAIVFQESMSERVKEITNTQNLPQNAPHNIPINNLRNQNNSNNLTITSQAQDISPTPERETTNTTPTITSALISAPQAANDTSSKPVIDVISNHQYSVKSYTREDGTDRIVLTDSHGVEYKPLTLKEFREKIGIVVVGKEHTPIIPLRSLFLMSILTIIGTLTRVSANKTNKLINPEYKNWIARLRKA